MDGVAGLRVGQRELKRVAGGDGNSGGREGDARGVSSRAGSRLAGSIGSGMAPLPPIDFCMI